MGTKLLNCYCDHCANNTCTTNQLCYAEWRLTNYDEIVSHLFATDASTTTTTTISNPAAQPLFKLEKTFNCFGKNDPLLIRTICNQTASNTSHVIRRCCRIGDYCNKLDNLLPTEQAAILEIQRIFPTNTIQNSQSLYEQYSDLPMIVQIVIVVIIVSLVLYTSVLINQAAARSRKRQRTSSSGGFSSSNGAQRVQHDYSIKGMINNFLIRVGMRSNSAQRNNATIEVTSNVSKSRLGKRNEEEASENHDTVGFDTNSIASREPLIRSLQKATAAATNSSTNTNTNTAPVDPMNVLHPHPNANDDATNRRRGHTLQMSVGSGAVEVANDTSSGSGQGQAYLSQRSISHDIQLVEIIGRGCFGVVWRGEYKGQPVAVKIFNTIAEASWERETEIYQTTMLRHKNILGLIATDKRHDSLTAGYWLVTDFYPMGSLFDFLSKNTISMWDAMRMAFSIADGLAHLHIEIFGTQAKPAVAHRDIKSKNILVKNDGTCCIADLGMAVRYNSSTGIVDVPSNTRIGTRRYLAPEILENRLNLLDFEAVKATDIYSFGLVLWEILRRTCLVPRENAEEALKYIKCEASEPISLEYGLYKDNFPAGRLPLAERTQQENIKLNALEQNRSTEGQDPVEEHSSNGGCHKLEQERSEHEQETLDALLKSYDENTNELAFACEDFQVPYQYDVSADPTAAEMYEAICVKKIRPRLSPRWLRFAPMRDYVTLMTECWYEKPQARLSALRLRKSFGDMASKYFNLNIMDYD
jgi:serine/threonine protein kinase